jgi:hypothetical protein
LGAGSIAAGSAAFAISFIVYLSLAHNGGPATATSYAELDAGGISTIVESKPVRAGNAISVSDVRYSSSASLASVSDGNGGEFSNRPEPELPPSAFGERFAFDSPAATGSLPTSQAFASFKDRFSGEGPASGGPVRSAATPRTTVARIPTPPKRPVIARSEAKESPNGGFQLASASSHTIALAYASPDPGNDPAIPNALKGLVPKDDPLADIDTSHTAIYDIAARTVYLPNGRRLEAHSGLGKYMDDARYVSQRMTGPTPPNVYKLRMRESLFHGVRAIRLIPQDESKMHGRSGILAHTYMLGPNGQSNGCVSFSNYSAFLDAYMRGDVTHLVVVERLSDAPSPKTAADWISNKLKDIFSRS